MTIDELVKWVKDEVERAGKLYPPMNSAHEAYAVLLEEVEELWTEIKKKPHERRSNFVTGEAIQVAAMSLRLILDLVNTGRLTKL
jgi:hypothetical protein